MSVTMAAEKNFEQRLFESEIERENSRNSNVKTLSQIGTELINSGRATTVEIHSNHDVHAFIRSSSDPDKIIHIQTYPGFSDPDNISIVIREMDYQKLIEIRALAGKLGGPSIGNEHLAVTRMITEGLTLGPVSQFMDLLRNELPLLTLEGTSTPVDNALSLE